MTNVCFYLNEIDRYSVHNHLFQYMMGIIRNWCVENGENERHMH